MNPSKAKGTAFETAIVGYLRENGFPYAERRTLAGANDLGDIAGLPGYVIEAKGLKVAEFGRGLSEAEKEARNADRKFLGPHPHAPILIAKRRGYPIARGYFVTTVETGVRLIREAEWCPHCTEEVG